MNPALALGYGVVIGLLLMDVAVRFLAWTDTRAHGPHPRTRRVVRAVSDDLDVAEYREVGR